MPRSCSSAARSAWCCAARRALPSPPRRTTCCARRACSARSRAGRAFRGLLAVCADADILGVPFYVMQELHGHVVTDALPALLATPDARRRAGHDLVDALAELHAVDIDLAGLARLRPSRRLSRAPAPSLRRALGAQRDARAAARRRARRVATLGAAALRQGLRRPRRLPPRQRHARAGRAARAGAARLGARDARRSARRPRLPRRDLLGRGLRADGARALAGHARRGLPVRAASSSTATASAAGERRRRSAGTRCWHSGRPPSSARGSTAGSSAARPRIRGRRAWTRACRASCAPPPRQPRAPDPAVLAGSGLARAVPGMAVPGPAMPACPHMTPGSERAVSTRPSAVMITALTTGSTATMRP